MKLWMCTMYCSQRMEFHHRHEPKVHIQSHSLKLRETMHFSFKSSESHIILAIRPIFTDQLKALTWSTGALTHQFTIITASAAEWKLSIYAQLPASHWVITSHFPPLLPCLALVFRSVGLTSCDICTIMVTTDDHWLHTGRGTPSIQGTAQLPLRAFSEGTRAVVKPTVGIIRDDISSWRTATL